MSESLSDDRGELQKNIDYIKTIARETYTPEFLEALNKFILYFKDLTLVIAANPTSQEAREGILKQIDQVLEITNALRDNVDSQAITGRVYGLSPEGKKMLRKGRYEIEKGERTIADAINLMIDDVANQANDMLAEVESIDPLSNLGK